MTRELGLLSAAFLSLVALSERARAECQCICANDQPIGICSQSYERPPLCQQICTRSLSQALATPGLNGPIAPGSVYGSPTRPSDLGAAARRFGIGSTSGASSAVLPE